MLLKTNLPSAPSVLIEGHGGASFSLRVKRYEANPEPAVATTYVDKQAGQRWLDSEICISCLVMFETVLIMQQVSDMQTTEE